MKESVGELYQSNADQFYYVNVLWSGTWYDKNYVFYGDTNKHVNSMRQDFFHRWFTIVQKKEEKL